MAQITVAEFALEINTDARTARRFLRSITPKDSCPGKGARWAIEKRAIRTLKKQFAEFTANENAKRAENAAKNAAKNASPAIIENDDADSTESDEPTDADLAEIDDEN